MLPPITKKTWQSTLTCNDPTKDGLFLFITAVPHGHPGSVGDGLTNVSSMDQVSQVLDSERRNPLPHDKA